jgi:hypothetical protein
LLDEKANQLRIAVERTGKLRPAATIALRRADFDRCVRCRKPG